MKILLRIWGLRLMIKKFRKVFKLFFVWQDKQEEKWLREMAQKGWLLKSYNVFYYNFVKSEPKDYIYKLDYKSSSDKDMDEYLKIFDDMGWEHVEQYLGWHYFRSEADNVKIPDIYSDKTSEIHKYKGLLKVLSTILVGISIIAISVVYNSIYDGVTYMKILRWVYVVLISLLGYAVAKTFFKIKKLKSLI